MLSRRKFLVGSTAIVGGLSAALIYWPRRWKYIVVHHSAGGFATIEFLQQVHRERQKGDPIDAIPYHYVIGNGNGLGLGEIASDWRKDYDIWGTHLSANNRARNFLGIGICMVGNFEITAVPQKQYESLVDLTRSLMARYDIAHDNVLAHGRIDGESSKCPGANFPLNRFRRDIRVSAN